MLKTIGTSLSRAASCNNKLIRASLFKVTAPLLQQSTIASRTIPRRGFAKATESTTPKPKPTPTPTPTQTPTPTPTQAKPGHPNPNPGLEDVQSQTAINSSLLKTSIENAVADFQKNASRITKERKRNILAVTFAIFTFVFVIFGKRIYNQMQDTTAEITGELITHESMQIKTSELAAAVVAHVLNDEQVMNRAAIFLRQAANNKETQLALIQLTNNVLQSPEVLAECNILVKKLFRHLLADKETTLQTVQLLSDVSMSICVIHINKPYLN